MNQFLSDENDQNNDYTWLQSQNNVKSTQRYQLKQSVNDSINIDSTYTLSIELF